MRSSLWIGRSISRATPLRYRSLVLSRFGLTADRDVPVHFEILDPAGRRGCRLAVRRGHASAAWPAASLPSPAELAGGQYTLVARAADGAFSEQKRTFFVRRYRLPRLKKELEFLRDSYGPGQTVAADFKAQRAEGGAAAGAKLRVVATVDGQTGLRDRTRKTTDAGTLHVEFKLPDKIERGDGQLAVIIDDGGSRETQAKTIPDQLGQDRRRVLSRRGRSGRRARKPRLLRRAKSARQTGRSVRRSSSPRSPASSSRVEESIAVRTAYEGMGAFRFTPIGRRDLSSENHRSPRASQRAETAGRFHRTRGRARHRRRRVCRRQAFGVQPPSGEGRAAAGRGGLLPRRAGRRTAVVTKETGDEANPVTIAAGRRGRRRDSADRLRL